jgi:isopenicillin N synthase-like dioxygenase
VSLPVVDVAPLLRGGDPTDGAARAARQIGDACRTHGFFYVEGHGVDPALEERLLAASRTFFALDEAVKAEIAMSRGGRAWRGWFPVGAELTSGRPDRKEGIYFGAELAPDDPRVREGWPLHGANQFPAAVPGLRAAVLAWQAAMTSLGHALMRGVAMSLGQPAEVFERRLTRDPLILFRIFHYPALSRDEAADTWSVGEHTDYGLLTILLQDDAGGLEVKSGGRWMPAPPRPGTFVCNIGDMLDRMTSGRYRSTPHRVRNTSGRSRLSFPSFFDPGFEAQVAPIDPQWPVSDDARQRWDGESVHAFDGPYGDYLVGKVSKVFPELSRRALAPAEAPASR